jgi:hypothetical protein
MTNTYVLKMVCPDCMSIYDVALIDATVTANGCVRGMAPSSADFCVACESPAVEVLGVVEAAS